jgi:hypothetical protein
MYTLSHQRICMRVCARADVCICIGAHTQANHTYTFQRAYMNTNIQALREEFSEAPIEMASIGSTAQVYVYTCMYRCIRVWMSSMGSTAQAYAYSCIHVCMQLRVPVQSSRVQTWMHACMYLCMRMHMQLGTWTAFTHSFAFQSMDKPLFVRIC